MTITRVFAHADAAKFREYADDIRDGKFHLPISRRDRIVDNPLVNA